MRGALGFLKIIVVVLLSVVTGCLFSRGSYELSLVTLALSVILSFSIYRKYRFLILQIHEFSEAVKYRDFTRHYVIRKPKTDEGRIFFAFNQINSAFQNINIDKELQQQYLSKVINMLDAGIIFYKHDTGKVIWLNDAFKQLFDVPHLGNIEGLKKKHLELYEKTMSMKGSEQLLETARSSKGTIKLLIQNSSFETAEGLFRIVVYQNVHEAMDETETKAWQKLLRVLTHEIMNSIAPISSLAATLHDRMEEGENHDLEELKLGLYTIRNRSEGLMQFAKSYRQINRADQPSLESVSVFELLEGVYQLLEPSMLQKGIDVDLILKDIRLVIQADRNLLEQVLINLLLNAKEAVSSATNPYISLSATSRNGAVQIQVSDNGRGMSPEILDQIFTPFFTTRKAGSGIGLTLSKQIMMLHNGYISVDSTEGKGTVFTLNF